MLRDGGGARRTGGNAAEEREPTKDVSELPAPAMEDGCERSTPIDAVRGTAAAAELPTGGASDPVREPRNAAQSA